MHCSGSALLSTGSIIKHEVLPNTLKLGGFVH